MHVRARPLPEQAWRCAMYAWNELFLGFSWALRAQVRLACLHKLDGSDHRGFFCLLGSPGTRELPAQAMIVDAQRMQLSKLMDFMCALVTPVEIYVQSTMTGRLELGDGLAFGIFALNVCRKGCHGAGSSKMWLKPGQVKDCTVR